MGRHSELSLSLLGTALLCAWTTSASAQSLADMAKRAEEQRKAGGGKSLQIEMGAAHGLRTPPLDKPEVEHDVSLRIALARLWPVEIPRAISRRVQSTTPLEQPALARD